MKLRWIIPWIPIIGFLYIMFFSGFIYMKFSRGNSHLEYTWGGIGSFYLSMIPNFIVFYYLITNFIK